jgi:thioredoxin-dependent peroxiredoxin
MTLVGDELKVGQSAPAFTLHFFDGGLKTLTLADLKGKPTLLNIVPSLDTGICQIQTKRFNQELDAMGDKVNAVTVSRDLPFAMNRFCGAESIKNLKSASDYQNGSFGTAYGLMIDELKLLARAVVVIDGAGKVTYVQTVGEVASEPDYAPALDAVKKLV